MRFPLKFVALIGAVALVVGSVSSLASLGRTQDEPKAVKSERGGLLAKSAHGQVEVFIFRTGLRVFPKTESGAAVGLAGLTGTATFYHPNSPAAWFVRPIEATSGSSLDLAIGLDAAPATGGKVVVEIAGLPGSEGASSEFTVPLTFTTGEGLPAAAADPRYVFGPGAAGFGYYELPGPTAAPAARTAPAVQNFPTQGASGARTTSRSRDWSTGRSDPGGGGVISKPWLRPRG